MNAAELGKRTGYKLAMQGTIVTELVIILLLSSFILMSTQSAGLIWQLVGTVGVMNVSTFVPLTLLFSYFLGRRAGLAFISSNKNRFLASYTTGFLIVICSTLSSALFALCVDSMTGNVSTDWFFLYIVKPIVWLMICAVYPYSLPDPGMRCNSEIG